jgi:cytochrome c oxidase assembly protein subunit 15/protoheme IX farnesyltransferase
VPVQLLARLKMAETAQGRFGAELDNTARAPSGNFSTFAAGVTLYMWLVALWGAVVRISMSGDGCGQHWPTCHGEIVHVPKSIETWIELSHRLTTGLALPATIALAVGAWRTFPPDSRVRHAAFVAVALTILEALIGARLVLGRLVGMDASVDRAIVMPLHLVTTSLLLGSLALTFAWSRVPPRPSHEAVTKNMPSAKVAWSVAAGVIGILVVSMTGAVTALGDTVFPAQAAGLGGRVVEDHGTTAHFLQRLRVVHPLVAVGVSGLLVLVTRIVSRSIRVRAVSQLKLAVEGLVYLQLACGLVNVLLSAPGYLQVIHLAVATALWLAFVLFSAAALDAPAPA